MNTGIISFRHEFRKILCFLCCYRKYTPPNSISANNNNNRTYTQNKRQPESEQGRDRNVRRPTVDDINSPIEESQAQKKDDATCAIGRLNSNHATDKTAHKNSETRRQLVDCAIEEEEEEEVAKPFLSSSTAGDQQRKVNNLKSATNKKLIDFSNRVDKRDADELSNDKVWI